MHSGWAPGNFRKSFKAFDSQKNSGRLFSVSETEFKSKMKNWLKRKIIGDHELRYKSHGLKPVYNIVTSSMISSKSLCTRFSDVSLYYPLTYFEEYCNRTKQKTCRTSVFLCNIKKAWL